MNLLLTNDDGVYAPGIRALALALKEEHSVTIVAPHIQRSGAGHSFTYATPLELKEVTLPGLEDISVFSLTGTPVDCTKLGLSNLGLTIDMVVSGINHGSNLGSDVLYSGTVGAAMEGALLGKQAIAVSNYALNPTDFSAACWAARQAVRYLSHSPLPLGRLLNVNAPDCSEADILGVKIAPLCLQEYEQVYTPFTPPSGKRFFFVPNGKLTQFGPEDDLDERWVQEGYVTITPLGFDLTDRDSLHKMDVAAFINESLPQKGEER